MHRIKRLVVASLVGRAVRLAMALSMLLGAPGGPLLSVPAALAAAPMALSFNGTNQYVEARDNPSLFLPANFTLEAWINPQSISGFHDIVGKGNYELAVQSSGTQFLVQLQVFLGGTWYTVSSGTFSYGQWYHVASTYDGATGKVYVNGLLSGQAALTGNVPPSTDPLRIGSVALSNDFFAGTIDEVRLSSVVRYTTNFAVPTTPFKSDVFTKGLWHLDEGSGTTTADASGNGNNGQLMNGPTWSATSPLPAPVLRTTPPVISAVSSGTPHATGATITWTTDVPSSSLVEYGATTTYGLQSVLDPAPATTHSVTLGGLSVGSVTNFRVRSKDADGNEAISGNFTLTTAAATATEIAQGEWSPLMQWPLVPVHTALLYTGQIMVFDAWETGGTPSVRLWNVNTGTFIPVADPYGQQFCSGFATLADGRVMVVGGHNGGEIGITTATAFNPATNSWSHLADMNFARWYPSVDTMGDGRVVALSGMITSQNWANTPEVYNPTTNVWSNLPVNTSNVNEDQYPLSFLAPNGKLFDLAPTNGSTRYLDMSTQTWSTVTSVAAVPQYGSAVMYRPGKVLYSGGGRDIASPNAEAIAQVMDLTASNPTWRDIAPMNFARNFHNFISLPDGKVLVVGGSSQTTDFSLVGPLQAEMWDPDTELWTTMASEAKPRMYHSTAVLLADGRVLVAGGGRWSGYVDQLNAEIYSPPYLFKGARPSITNAPTSTTYGSSMTIQTPDAASISSVSLVGIGTNTHTLDTDQRFVPLSFTAGAGQLTVTVPSSGNIAPAGYYMLFIVNSNGVPSVAATVQLGGTSQAGQPPSVSITAPTSGATVTGSAVAVSANASSSLGIGSVQFQLDGAALGAPVTSAPYQISWNSTTASNGAHNLTARATDVLGTSTTSSVVGVTVTNPPTISNVASSNITTSGATITWTTNTQASSEVDYGTTTAYGSTQTDASLVTSHSQSLSGLTLATTYHYRVKSTDSGGNTATSGDFTFTTAANTSVTLVGDQAVETTVDNNGAGSAEAFQYTAGATGSVNQLNLYVDATNTATQIVVGLYTNNNNNPGTLLTEGTISTPTKGAWNSVNVSAASVTANSAYWIAVLSPSGSGTVQFRDRASGARTQASAQTNLTALPATWSPGANYANSPMSAYAAQLGGGDTQPPSVSITAPTAGSTLSGTVAVTASATDNVGVTSVQFTLDGANLGAAVTAAPYQVNWDTTSATNGTHTLSAKASDTSGNLGAATNVSVTVNNPPTISNAAVSNILPTGATISWNTNQPATSQVDYGSTTAEGTFTTLDSSLVTSHSQTLSGLTPSTRYYCQVISTNAGGTTVTSQQITFTTAAAAPVTLVGDTTIEANRDNNPAGSAEAFQYVAGAAGTVNQLTIYLDASNTAKSVIVGLYTDIAGNPGTLLTSGTIATPTAGAWNSVTVPAASVSTGTTYWVAILGPSGSGTVQFRDKAMGGKTQSSAQTNLTTLPSTWSPGANWANSPMSAYASQTQ